MGQTILEGGQANCQELVRGREAILTRRKPSEMTAPEVMRIKKAILSAVHGKFFFNKAQFFKSYS